MTMIDPVGMAYRVEEAGRKLAPYLSRSQAAAMRAGVGGEEGGYFQQLFLTLVEQMEALPPLYHYEATGAVPMANLHYFRGGSDIYVSESEGPHGVSFGFSCLNGDYQMAELGYLFIPEIASAGFELDLHYTPEPLDAVVARYKNPCN